MPVTPREHPYNGGPDLLYSVLPGAALSDGMESGKLQWAVAWLPSDTKGPIPSSELIGPRTDRRARRLAPWTVSTLAVNPHMLDGLFLGYDRGEKLSPGRQLGADVLFWRHALELAGSLVVRQQFLPGVLETLEDPSRWLPFWDVVWEVEDLERLALLAAAMPMAARAVNQKARKPPLDEPRLQARDVVMRLVDHLVWMGHINDSVWEHYLRPRRRKTASLHERWVETLMTPDLELTGEDAEVLELCRQIDAWSDAVFRLRPEYEHEATTISLPPEGKDFWAGRELPLDFLGPVEAPLNPALILRRVGELPGWQGERMLRDSLEPVYHAASRYAQEYVFGQKS